MSVPVSVRLPDRLAAELAEVARACARSEPSVIQKALEAYLGEEADEFEREVAALGSSDKFRSFLRSRSAETEESSAAEVAHRLGLDCGQAEGAEEVGGADAE